MAIEIIDKLKPKNNSLFKIIDLDDIDYDGNGTSAKEILENNISSIENNINNIPIITNDLTNELKTNYDIAYTHSQSYHFDGNYNSLNDLPIIPTLISQLENDNNYISSIPEEYITENELDNKGFLTEHQDLSNYALNSDLHSHDNKTILDNITDVKINEWNNKSTFSGSYEDLTEKPIIPSIQGLATETFVTDAINKAQLEGGSSDIDLSIYAKTSDLSIVAFDGNYNSLTNRPDIPSIQGLATETFVNEKVDTIDLTPYVLKESITTIATTGSYNDLTDKPTIPSIDGLATIVYVNEKFSSIDFSPYALSSSLSEVATTGSYNSLSDKPIIPTIPTLAKVATSGSYNDLNNIPVLLTMEEVKTYVDEQIANINGSGSEEDGDGEPDIEVPEMIDFAYADEIVNIAKTYWANSDNEGNTNGDWATGFTYRSSNTPLSASCEVDLNSDYSLWKACGSEYYKAIDCSTVANLYLRGYTYDESPYASLSSFNAFRKDRLQRNTNISWSMAPTTSSGGVARSAAQLGEYFYNKGRNWIVYDKETMGSLESVVGTSTDNYPGIKKGDLAFWAKSTANETQKSRWRSISHVGLAYGENSSGKSCFIESTNAITSTSTKKHTVDGVTYNAGMIIRSIENADPEEIVLIIRLQV